MADVNAIQKVVGKREWVWKVLVIILAIILFLVYITGHLKIDQRYVIVGLIALAIIVIAWRSRDNYTPDFFKIIQKVADKYAREIGDEPLDWTQARAMPITLDNLSMYLVYFKNNGLTFLLKNGVIIGCDDISLYNIRKELLNQRMIDSLTAKTKIEDKFKDKGLIKDDDTE